MQQDPIITKAIDDAERIVINARLAFQYHHSHGPEPLALQVLSRVQFHINCNRYTDAAHAELLQRSRGLASIAFRLWYNLDEQKAYSLAQSLSLCRQLLAETPHSYTYGPSTPGAVCECGKDRYDAIHQTEDRERCDTCHEYNVNCTCEDEEEHDESCDCETCDPFNFKKHGLV